MDKKTAPFSIQKNGCYLHWDAIPAFVCDQCGEMYFAEHQVDTIIATLVVQQSMETRIMS
jgi:YgiT-type zinc finger domain-containing protein